MASTYIIGNVNQSSEDKIIVILPTGLTFSNVTCSYIRQNDSALYPYTLTSSNFTEISNGKYSLKLAAAMTSIVGSLYIGLSGGGEDVTIFANVVEKNPGIILTTISVTTAAPAPIPEVSVAIYNDTQDALLWSGSTDNSGTVSVGLNPGSYKVMLLKSGYTFTSPESMMVIGPLPEAKSFTGAAVAIPSAGSPTTCLVYGNIFDITGTPDNGESPDSIVVNVQKTPSPISRNNRLYTMDAVSTVVDETGYFQIELVRGLSVRILISRINLDKTFTVPDQASVDISSII